MTAKANKISRVYVRHYSDNGQTMAYVDWADGSRTCGDLHYLDHPHRTLAPTFGAHMHALFARAKREGLRLQRETW